ncbi:MAG: hypothetical protein J0L99_16900 [Chitinophagales bacterium]|nr:hypothetical protein [Chitinophagales bacterium]
MKNIFLLSAFAFLLPNAALAQSHSIRLACAPDGSIVATAPDFNVDTEISFDVAALNCCNPEKLKIRVKKSTSARAAVLDWAKNERSFTLDSPSAELNFECGGSKGKLTLRQLSATPAGPVTPPPPPAGPSTPPPSSPPIPELYVGNTLQDALELSRLWKLIRRNPSEADREAAQRILEHHNITPADFQQIVYLKKYTLLNPADKVSAKLDKAAFIVKKAEAAPASGLGNFFSPTLVADALGKFAAKRFKEELTLAFLQRFRDTLQSPAFDEMRLLFPRTFYTVSYADPFQYSQFYQSLHENAQSDLSQLPENMSAVVRGRKAQIDPEVYPAILGGLDAIQLLEARMPASAAIEMLAYRDYINLEQQSVYGNGMRTLGIFSKHLHGFGESTPTGWGTETQLAALLTDRDAFNFWMALLLKNDEEDLSKIRFGDKSLFELLNLEDANTENAARNLTSRFAGMAATARLSAMPDNSSERLQESHRYLQTTFELLETAIEIAAVLDKNSPPLRYQRARSVLRAARNLDQFARSGRYGDALSVGIETIRLLYPADPRTENLLSRIDRYGNLLVSMANAQNADEIVALLEEVAAPVQSYTRKRGSEHFSVSLNLYPGLAAGMEYRLPESESGGAAQGGFFAFTTPVGLSIDKGMGKNGSIGLFFSLVDVGAITAFRLQDGVSLLPELKWANLFAPGLYLQLGLGKTPLSLGLGGQYGPALRQVGTDGQGNDISARHFRAGVSLTVDVPLLFIK